MTMVGKIVTSYDDKVSIWFDFRLLARFSLCIILVLLKLTQVLMKTSTQTCIISRRFGMKGLIAKTANHDVVVIGLSKDR